ncbi:hypothetical protein GS481_01800 [Rhodococcus hoagii]|nr:hypothetical protein [Prescottella equi]
MTDTCEHCGLPVYVMVRPRTDPKLVHRGTHLAECSTAGQPRHGGPAMSLMDAKVGDTVVVYTRSRHAGSGAREGRVAKVGRKYLYLDGGGVSSQAKFSRETGREVSDYEYTLHVYLPEEWAAKERRDKVVARIRREHNIRHESWNFPQSTETLEAILQILDADTKTALGGGS